ncbi:unnamed protein product, partial [Ectocarpus sp. 12 AP-2014]
GCQRGSDPSTRSRGRLNQAGSARTGEPRGSVNPLGYPMDIAPLPSLQKAGGESSVESLGVFVQVPGHIHLGRHGVLSCLQCDERGQPD